MHVGRVRAAGDPRLMLMSMRSFLQEDIQPGTSGKLKSEVENANSFN